MATIAPPLPPPVVRRPIAKPLPTGKGFSLKVLMLVITSFWGAAAALGYMAAIANERLAALENRDISEFEQAVLLNLNFMTVTIPYVVAMAWLWMLYIVITARK